MAATRRVRVFLNRRSGAGDCAPEEILKAFEHLGCICELTQLEPDLDLRSMASRDHTDTVWIAAGGDGTVNCVANATAGSGRAMGVLPGGTLNHFAQDTGIPSEMDDAIQLAATGSPRTIDAAEVNGQVFVNNSSLGFYPAMVADRERMKKSGANKWLALALASLKAFVRFPCVRVELELEGQARDLQTALLFVGNNPYAMDAGNLGTRKSMNTGLLSVCIVPGKKRLAMLRLFAAALAGRARQADELECFNVSTLTVKSRKTHLHVSFDGEIRRMRTPLRYLARPGALRVIAPDAEAR